MCACHAVNGFSNFHYTTIVFTYLTACCTNSNFLTVTFVNLIINRIFPGKNNSRNDINRMIHSSPSSPQSCSQGLELNSFEVIGSAESLVSQVLARQGLRKYCDPTFVAKELSEALNMTQNQMDIEAYSLFKECAQEQHQQHTPPQTENKCQDDKL